jgi:hypothetical protein
MKRFADLCRYIGMAVALRYTTENVAAIYGLKVNLEIPLPPYPGIVVETRQLVLV